MTENVEREHGFFIADGAEKTGTRPRREMLHALVLVPRQQPGFAFFIGQISRE